MTIEKPASEELRKRKIEFLSKLKELIKDYAAEVSYFDLTYRGMPEHYAITTDAHHSESWNGTVYLKELEEEEIDFCIDELKLDLNK